MSAKTPCLSREFPDLWVSEYADEREQAKELCNTCPIKDACLAGAIENNEVWGVWGGVNLDVKQRGGRTASVRQCRNRECGKDIDRKGTRRRYCDDVCRARESYLTQRGAAA